MVPLKELATMPDKLFILVFSVLVELLAIGGNLLIVEAVRRKRTLRSTTNILLANVALADLVCCAFLPLMLVQRSNAPLQNGIGADLLCKLLIDYHVPITASTASILTLLVVSVERYNAIVKPMKVASRLTKETVYRAIMLVWLVSVIITLPLYIFGHYNAGDHMCKNGYPASLAFETVSLIPFVILVLLLPCFVNFFCYCKILRELYSKNQVGAAHENVLTEEDKRTRKKLTIVCLSITAVNSICFMPLVCMGFLKYLKIVPHNYLTFGVVMFFLGIALNPLVYAFQSTNFRQAFKEILRRKAASNSNNIQNAT